ncbi:class I SAM-dependent methyltransferase, partial [Calditrichota bacterium]
LWSAPFGLKLLDVVKLCKNIKVLDIGSGNGFPIIELSQRLGDTCQLFGVDPWKEAVERIELKIKSWNIKNVEIIVGKAETLPFEDNYFDLVVSNNGTNNVENDNKVMSEISRVVKKDGQMVITMNLPESMLEFYNVYESVLNRKNKLNEIEKLKQHIFEKRKPIDYTKHLIENVGFRIKNIYKDSFDLRFTDGTTMLNHFLIKVGFLESWLKIVDTIDVEAVFSDIEDKLNKIAEKNGEIKLTIPWICIDSEKI